MERVLGLKGRISQTYFCDRPMTDKDFANGRKVFLLEGCCANGVAILTTGAFLSGYAQSLGANDSINGIIGSIPLLLCTLQMFSALVVEHVRQRKLLISGFSLLHRLLLSSMFFVPVLISEPANRLFAVIAIYALAHCFNAFISTGTGNWLLTLVPHHMRGSYLGKKDGMAFAFSTVLSLVMGQVLDGFRASHMEQTGFFIIGLVVLVIAVTNFACLSAIKEPPVQPHQQKLTAALWEPLADRTYRKVIFVYMFWNLALQIAGPFFSVYMVTGLKLDYAYITFLGLISSSVRVLASCLWGKLADTYSWLKVARCSMFLLGVVHFSWVFMTPETCYVLQPILQALSGAAWGGISIAVFNLQYHYAPTEKRVLYVSANSSYAGLCGFFATLIGAMLVAVLPSVDVGGLVVTGMQVIFVLSGIMIFMCVRYMRRLVLT